ncbi:integrase, catalytic region, zinc finger, CCHC-type containing protein [Tanacetum coccineum]
MLCEKLSKFATKQSLDATKKPSSSDSSNGKLFINDNISLKELRNFVDKSMQEESVLEHVGNNDINSCTSRENQGEKVSSNSSGRSGQPLEEDAYDDYEDQFEENPCSYQEFCDQFDFKVKGLGRIFTLGEQCPLTRLTKSKVVPAKQTENYQTVPIILPTSPENQAIAASMQSTIAYANQQEPTKIRDPSFQTLHLCLFSNAGRTDRPLGQLVDSGMTTFMISWVMLDYVIGDSSSPGKHSCYVCNTNGVELIKGSCGSNLYTILVKDMMKSSPICLLSKASKNNIFHQESVPRTPQQNDVIERRNRTLVEAARTMLIFSKAPMTRTYVSDAWTDKLMAPYNQSCSSYVPPTNKEAGVIIPTDVRGNNLSTSFVLKDGFSCLAAVSEKPSFKASSSEDVSSAESTYVTQPHHHLGK